MNLLRPLRRSAVLVALLHTSPVFAMKAAASEAEPPRDPAAAEALYKTARELLAKEDWAGACSKFDASFELDPVASTLINIAKCSEHEGKLAQAWTQLKRAKVLNQETQGEERKRTLANLIDTTVEELERRLPRLSLVVTPKPADLYILRNDVSIPLAALGEPIPIDPGVHKLVVGARGYDTVERVISVDAAKLVAVDIRLSDARPASSPGGPSTAPSAAAAEASVPVWPFITGGLGLVAIGVGVGFRIDGMSAESNLDEHCGEARLCDPSGSYDPADDNQRKNVDYGAFLGLTIGGGAALLGTAIGVIVEVATSDGGERVGVHAPRAAAVSFVPFANESSAGLGVTGTFQ